MKNRVTDFLDASEPGATITLKMPGLEASLTTETAKQYLDKLFDGMPDLDIPGLQETDLDRLKAALQTEIDIRLHNNQMLIKAIEDRQQNI